jgi:ADP-heptose:LPS heptosyltransferase
LPAGLRSRVKALWRKFQAFRDKLLDPVFFRLWLAGQCLRRRQKAVVICRTGALGDVICALPLCVEARKLHPGTFIVFVTHYDYKRMVVLSPDVNEVYGGKSWAWPFSLPDNFNFLGLVEKIYCPKTSSEVSKNGPKCHLMEDLAGSCGITLSNPNPRLIVPQPLLNSIPVKFGFAEYVRKNQLIIGINPGQVWAVRMWDAAKWQELLNLIHAEFDVAFLQLGFRKGDADEYDRLKGVQCVLRMQMSKDELVALVACCDLMISVDSGPTHISGAVGTPLVGLYGALNPQHFLPRHTPATGIYADVPCLFCNDASPIGHWQSGCPNNIRCMKELDVPTVFKAVKEMLEKHEKRAKSPVTK